MSTRNTILTSILALVVLLALNTPFANANATRELTGTIGGSFEGTLGLAVDLETGNVYVADNNTDTIDIYNATGGPPAGGVPSQITGLTFHQSGGGEEGTSPGIAVDNSCYEHEPRLTGEECEKFDPAYGDVYATYLEGTGPKRNVRQYGLNSKNEYELIGLLPVHSGLDNVNCPAQGLAVDSEGNVYSASYFGGQDTFHGSLVEQKASGEELEFTQNIVERPGFVALGASGDVYAGNYDSESVGVVKLKIGALGEVLSEELFAPTKRGFGAVAVDRSTGSVFVGQGNGVAEYSEAGGEPLLEFGSEEPNGGSLAGKKAITGIAVNSVTGRVYVANTSRGDVDVFGPVLNPASIPAEQPEASDVTRTSVLLAGTVDPEGGGASYYYEYVPAGEYEPGATNPYAHGGRTASSALPSAHVDESVERVVLSGLSPGTTYHYRIAVHNANTTTYGPDQTFTTAPATPPTVLTGAAVDVGSTSVTLTGTIGPRGLPSSYVFEVGTGTSYDGARLFGNAGNSTGEVQASVALQYLVPGTTYHYRLMASSFDGTSYGEDETFTTPGIPSPIGQPASTSLIATPNIAFPSIAGATTGPTKLTTKHLTNAQKRKSALESCKKKPKKQRAACEKQATKKYKKTK